MFENTTFKQNFILSQFNCCILYIFQISYHLIFSIIVAAITVILTMYLNVFGFWISFEASLMWLLMICLSTCFTLLIDMSRHYIVNAIIMICFSKVKGIYMYIKVHAPCIMLFLALQHHLQHRRHNTRNWTTESYAVSKIWCSCFKAIFIPFVCTSIRG